MSRYIDIEEAEKVFKQMEENDVELYGGVHISECFDADRAIDALKEIPTADVEEVKHGKWISELVKKCDWKGNKQSYYQPISCSLCHEPQAIKYPYCPHCGARMNKEKEI